MKLSVKALALAAGTLWALAVLLTAIANILWTGYGAEFLTMLGSIYPGYAAGSGIRSVAVVTLYSFVDGLIGGAVFAWLYNQFVS